MWLKTQKSPLLVQNVCHGEYVVAKEFEFTTIKWKEGKRRFFQRLFQIKKEWTEKIHKIQN